MASGLSMPVGFKNPTDGNIQIEINAIKSAGAPHSFLGIDRDGRTAVINTTGNPNAQMVLRGGDKQPNVEQPEVTYAACKLVAAGLEPSVMVDCSHANSRKNPNNQAKVWESLLEQRAEPNCPITVAMIESFIEKGSQKIGPTMKYGQSVTDGCIDWATIEKLLNM